jgi:glycosyltransferase involved in cell wall biosynthesis
MSFSGQDLVTVIIPSFNHAQYIEQSVKSILDQTYRNLELIVVDDGSTDDTMAALAGFTDPRFRVVEQENSGPSAAINHGLRLARGEFLALLGSDDIAEPGRIAGQVEVLQATRHSAVFSKPAVIDAEGIAQPNDDQVRIFDSLPEGNTAADHIRMLFYRGNYFCAPSACIRRAAVERVGFFHEGLVHLQDLDYWIRMFGQAMTCVVQEHKLVRYRRHGRNLSHTQRNTGADREGYFIFQHFFEHVEPRIARVAFEKVLDPRQLDLPLSADECGMVYLSHSRKNIRELAYGCFVAERQVAALPLGTRLLSFPEYCGVLNEE